MSWHVVVMKLPITVTHSCRLLNHPNSFHGVMVRLKAKFDAGLLLCSLSHLGLRWPHRTRAHSTASTTLTDQYSEVIIVHTCAFQSTLQCCANCCYINSGWAFSGQTLYMLDTYAITLPLLPSSTHTHTKKGPEHGLILCFHLS